MGVCEYNLYLKNIIDFGFEIYKYIFLALDFDVISLYDIDE